ncbi:helix-turn-helix domain-containing protein [Virgibacillus oceani]|uniref:AraC family transcriptional regulator n=1 Tax=Virgibacillus oceani TaxID=1479511 RepID=A0A917HFN1_9BACI|nr:helix-turn-helix domain-containing protein [Virgibacillus oceani]GGG77078.1 AraC family transcriptional regulator [Virgibacillus oceani]
MKHSLEEIKYICQLIYEAHRLSVFYMNKQGEFKLECSASDFHKNAYYISLKDQLKAHSQQHSPEKAPVHFSLAAMHFFLIHLKTEHQYHGTIIIGPCLESQLDNEKINVILNTLGGSVNKRTLLTFYQTIPVIDPQQFLSISLLTYYLIYQQKLNQSAIKDMGKNESNVKSKDLLDLEISKRRRNFISHSNLSHERVLLDYVKNGQTDKVKDVIRYSIIGEDEFGSLAKHSRIRSEKNLMITGVALICRAAIEGGLNEETAFTLNDYYIQQIEERESIVEISTIMTEAVNEFTERVSKLKKSTYSAAIIICQRYIYNHLYEEITLGQLARISNLSPNYLSGLFKKEAGLSISKYIQRQRVDEAKKLLSLTTYPISEIYSWLNFNDQSYFIKVFKKFTGKTPKQFRNGE